MKVLVLNSGSSSIKYRLLDLPGGAVPAWGELERIGSPQARFVRLTPSGRRVEMSPGSAGHRSSWKTVFEAMKDDGVLSPEGGLAGIGHRVVQGGEIFREAALVDLPTLDAIRSLSPLAPLHNPVNAMGIEAALEFAPGVPQVAVFDTAFHQTLPPHAFRYALPAKLYTERRIRRFGFHGTSHAYVSRRAGETLGRLGRARGEINLVSLHLGNGASAAAVRGGKSVDTSMGMTPLEGLVMGTRSGDLDPAISFHLMRETGASPGEVERLLMEKSGLAGLAGSADMREVLARAEGGDEEARLAVDLYTYRIKKYVGAYLAVLGRVDAVVFTGGIGENSPEIRARSLAGLEGLGIAIDAARNEASSREEREVGAKGAPVAVLVIPTNEELEIATQTLACMERGHGPA